MYARYLEVAAAHGFVALMGGLDYRASPDWASKLNISRDGLAEFQLRCIEFLRDCGRSATSRPAILKSSARRWARWRDGSRRSTSGAAAAGPGTTTYAPSHGSCAAGTEPERDLRPARGPLGLALQRIPRVGHPHLPRHRRAALLHDMRQLVGQQLAA